MGRVQGKWRAVLVAATCGLLGACSHSHGGGATPVIKRHDAGTPGGGGNSPGNSADPGPKDLVSAVSGGAGDGPVGLKFQVGQRPQAGQAVVITLRLMANQPLERLEARFHADEGLQLTQGGDFDPPGHMDVGDTVDHALTLVPDHEGIFTVMATVTTGSEAEGISRSFVIPIVVAAATPASVPAAKPTVAAKTK